MEERREGSEGWRGEKEGMKEVRDMWKGMG